MSNSPTTPATPALDARVEALERRMRDVETRLAPRPRPDPATAPAPSPVPARPARRPDPTPRATPRPRPSFDLERFLGGHVLAWIGGIAVLAGLALLFALGISRGWIGPVGRTATGAALSAALVLAGIWLHERKGRTEAARAAVACGAAGLFLAITVAARVYEIVPPTVGLVLAGAVAAGTALLAVRWTAPVIGALGLAGALLAPVLAGATLDLPTLAFLLVAAVGASAVLLRRRWIWLSLAVFAIPGAQLVAWIGDRPGALAAAAVLGAFGVVNVVAALGVDIRARETPLRFAGAYLLGANALLLTVGGWVAIDGASGRLAGVAWLAALAAAHAAVGTLARRRRRISSELALLALALATLIADTAFALTDVSAPVKACAWALTAIAFAWLARRGHRSRASEALLGLGVGGQVALTLVEAVALLDPSDVLAPGAGGGVVVALLALASCCLVSGRLARAGHPAWRMALDTCGLLATAMLSLVLLDGPALTVAWAGAAIVLAQLGARDGDPLARWASLAQLGCAAIWCLADQAPPADLFGGLGDWVPAAIGLGALAVASGRVALLSTHGGTRRRVLVVAAATLPVYLVAVAAGGAALTAALGLAAVALAAFAQRDGDGAIRAAALGQLAGAVCWWVADQAWPAAIVDGSAALPSAALGGAVIVLVAQRLVRTSPAGTTERRALWALMGLAPLYLASVAVLAWGPSAGAGFAPAQQGELALSALWAVTGVAALVAGLRRDLRDLRLGALGLLAVTIAKVFLYDLATLTSGWRICSFLALGLLLLGAGFAYQRMRPGLPAERAGHPA